MAISLNTEEPIDASETTKLTKDARQLSMGDVYIAIKNAAREGDRCTRYDLKGRYAKFVSEVMKILKSRGFEVKHEFGSDQREGTEWNYISIYWPE